MKLLLLAVPLCALFLGCRTNESPEAQAADFKIAANVKTKLVSDLGLSTVPNIDVNVTNGVVTLAGQVSSAETKTQAEAIAKSIPNVVRVVNNLQVAAKTSVRYPFNRAWARLYPSSASTTAVSPT
jgi:hypothetical protein